MKEKLEKISYSGILKNIHELKNNTESLTYKFHINNDFPIIQNEVFLFRTADLDYKKIGYS